MTTPPPDPAAVEAALAYFDQFPDTLGPDNEPWSTTYGRTLAAAVRERDAQLAALKGRTCAAGDREPAAAKMTPRPTVEVGR
jgi:hypothetical protein